MSEKRRLDTDHKSNETLFAEHEYFDIAFPSKLALEFCKHWKATVENYWLGVEVRKGEGPPGKLVLRLHGVAALEVLDWFPTLPSEQRIAVMETIIEHREIYSDIAPVDLFEIKKSRQLAGRRGCLGSCLALVLGKTWNASTEQG